MKLFVFIALTSCALAQVPFGTGLQLAKLAADPTVGNSCSTPGLYSSATSTHIFVCNVNWIQVDGGGGTSTNGTSGQFLISNGSGGYGTAVGPIVPKASGGTGTATPALVAGTNVTITGSWPNQTVNSSAGGGGASSSFTLTDFATTAPTTTTISSGAACVTATPCNAMLNNTTYRLTGGPWATSISGGGSGSIYQYIDNAGTMIFDTNAASVTVATGAGFTVAATGGFPNDSLPLYRLTVVSGSITAVDRFIPFISHNSYYSGSGISIDPTTSQVAVDSTSVARTSSSPGSSGLACTNPGTVAPGASTTFYVCNTANRWVAITGSLF